MSVIGGAGVVSETGRRFARVVHSEPLELRAVRDQPLEATMANERDKSHPVGEGVGAAGGAAAGAVAGAAVGGPVGAVVGAAVGAVAGGMAGHGVAAAIDPQKEDAYWRDNYKTRPYVKSGTGYDQYRDAYRYGWESRAANPKAKYDDVEPTLERGWSSARGSSSLAWQDAKQAVRDSWHRIEDVLPGDADHDGR
jgi:uncharacterized protein YcfJ